MPMAARGRSEAECFLARECSHCGKTFLHALGRPYQMVVILMRKRRKRSFSTNDTFCYTNHSISLKIRRDI